MELKFRTPLSKVYPPKSSNRTFMELKSHNKEPYQIGIFVLIVPLWN